MPNPSRPPAREWLSLGPASRILGVDPGTLRRWADEGRVVAFTTPGGHRRFDRRGLERLVAARRRGVRRPIALLGATPDRISRAYRRSYRAAAGRSGVPVASVVAVGSERDAFRQDGRRLVEALLAFLDAPDDALAARSDAERAAITLTDDIASRLARSGVSLTDAVELFVAARRPFLAELGQLAGRRALDPGALSGLYEDAAAVLDRLLLRLIATHQAPAATTASASSGLST